MFKKIASILAVAAAFSGCATSPTDSVIPLQNGQYEITSDGASKDEALKASLASAEATCAAKKMRHVVLSRDESYKGVVSESTNKTIDKAARVLTAVSNSWMPTLSNGDDYQTKLTFTCEH